MSVYQLVELASSAYPEGLPIECLDRKGNFKGNVVGDSLAAFVASEIHDLYDSGASDFENLREAARGIARAGQELLEVYRALATKRDDLAEIMARRQK